MDPSGCSSTSIFLKVNFEPEAPALQGQCSIVLNFLKSLIKNNLIFSRLSYGPIMKIKYVGFCVLSKKIKGGDPSAGSPTDTL